MNHYSLEQTEDGQDAKGALTERHRLQQILHESRGRVLVLGPGLKIGSSLPGGTPCEWDHVDAFPSVVLNGEAAFRSSARTACWRLQRGVTLIVHDDSARILATHIDRFHALDPIGTRMLLEAMLSSSDEMVASVSEEFGVPAEQVRKDWIILRQALGSQGIIEFCREDAERSSSRLVSAAWVELALVSVALFLLGWERTVLFWRFRSRKTRVVPKASPAKYLEAVSEAVKCAASLHQIDMQCKERALVSWILLRKCGYRPRLVIGVALYPFESHAWVECMGQVVGDNLQRCAQFVPVLCYE